MSPMSIKKRFHSSFQFTLIQSLFISILISIGPLPSVASVSSLDFGWGSPILINRPGQKQLLAWPIQITNPTKRPWFAKLDVVAVTNTGKQYNAISDANVAHFDGISPLSVLKSHIFPAVTRQTIALFEGVDPGATVIHFYVGGIVNASQKEGKEPQYFRVTYQRTADAWLWKGSNILE